MPGVNLAKVVMLMLFLLGASFIMGILFYIVSTQLLQEESTGFVSKFELEEKTLSEL